MSFSSTRTSTSSASGSTATVTVEVWMRPLASVSGTRCTRWTPRSNLSRLQAPALDEEHDLLEAAHSGLVLVHELDLPLLSLGVLRVHPGEVRREEAGLVSPRARPDLHEDVPVVVGVAGNEECAQLLLELALAPLEIAHLGLGELAHLAIGLLGGHATGRLEAAQELLVVLEFLHDLAELGGGLGRLGVQRRLGEDGGIGERPVQLAVTVLDLAELVKHDGPSRGSGRTARSPRAETEDDGTSGQ